jgi:hypothetical protein
VPARLTPRILPLAIVPCILSSRVLDLAFTSLYLYLPSSLFSPWVWFGTGERHRHAAAASVFPSLEASWRFVDSTSRTRSQHHVRIQYTMLRGVVVCPFLFFGSVLSLFCHILHRIVALSNTCALINPPWKTPPVLQKCTSCQERVHKTNEILYPIIHIHIKRIMRTSCKALALDTLSDGSQRA